MGAGLACMVSRLTLGKPKYADVQAEIEQLLQQADQLRRRFVQLMQADIEAYSNLSACFKMPRSTDEEKTARTRAIQERLHEAALVPLEIVERSAELAQCCERVAEIGNINVLSDIATAAMLAVGAAQGAAWMVRVNLQSMKDQVLVERLQRKLTTALATVEALSQRVTTRVGERA
jgi:formiminotetrahydrofolate cyclodeaminase